MSSFTFVPGVNYCIPPADLDHPQLCLRDHPQATATTCPTLYLLRAGCSASAWWYDFELSTFSASVRPNSIVDQYTFSNYGEAASCKDISRAQYRSFPYHKCRFS